jgi:hypothetical protein
MSAGTRIACQCQPSVSIDLWPVDRVFGKPRSVTPSEYAGSLSRPQLLHQWRQERVPSRLRHAAARQPLRDLQKHLGGAMARGDFRDHLAIVGRRAEQV